MICKTASRLTIICYYNYRKMSIGNSRFIVNFAVKSTAARAGTAGFFLYPVGDSGGRGLGGVRSEITVKIKKRIYENT